MSALAGSLPRRRLLPRVPTVRLRSALFAGALALGGLGGYLASSGHASRVLALAIVLLPVAIWTRPYLGPSLLLGAALLVEQNDGIPHIPLTSRLPLFQGIGPGHLQGADILLVLVGIVYLAKGAGRRRWRPRSHVSLAIGLVLTAVLVAIGVGHHHQGSLRVALMEARPYVYLTASYFLTAVLVTNRRAVRTMLWTFVLVVAFKALQGIYVYFGHRHDYPRPESFIGHEASYFFVIYFLLVLALWLFHESGRLRTVSTRLAPVVFFCDLVNDRRAAWLMLGGAVLTLGVIAYQTLPGRRRVLGRCLVALMLITSIYLPIFWNKDGSISQPARAIQSQIHPTTRDASSDLYRVQENANLKLNIKQNGVLGKGFGVKIDYALPIVDISSIDALIAYIPHNDVLDVMMRMGLLGGVAMWFLIGAGIISGCRLARAADREVAMIGAVVASALVGYALMGAVDQGFFWFRIAFVTGGLLGLSEAVRRMERARIAAVRTGGA